jgi:hypothetical protein
MDTQRLITSLRQIKLLAEELLVQAGPRHAPAKKVMPSKATKLQSLPAIIIRLRDEGFFTQPKSADDVREKLGSTYACDVNRVAVALLRLQRKKTLRKTEKKIGKRKHVAFVW